MRNELLSRLFIQTVGSGANWMGTHHQMHPACVFGIWKRGNSSQWMCCYWRIRQKTGGRLRHTRGLILKKDLLSPIHKYILRNFLGYDIIETKCTMAMKAEYSIDITEDKEGYRPWHRELRQFMISMEMPQH